MIQKYVMDLLKGFVPSSLWKVFWIVLPASALILLPVGLPVLLVLAQLGINEAPRWTQLLMLFSVTYGPICGLATLWLVRHSGIPANTMNASLWLGRFAVVLPLLMLLGLLLIFSRT